MAGWWAGRRRYLGAVALVLAPFPSAGFLSGRCAVIKDGPGCVVWVDQWKTNVADETARLSGRAVATTRDGSLVFVTGYNRDLAYEAATGRLVWSAPNGGGGAVGGQDIAVSPSGSFVVGVSEGRYPHPGRVVAGEVVVTAHEPATGAERWQARYRDPDLDTYTGRAVAASNSRVFVTGGRATPHEIATLAFDATTGAHLWLRHHGRVPGGGKAGNSLARGVDVVATPDGSRVFVTGFITEREPFVEWVTIAYDGATGAPLWTRSVSSPDDAAAEPKEMTLHPDGKLLYVTGWGKQPGLGGQGSFDFVTVAYDTSTGDRVWTGGYRSPFASAAVDSDDLGWSLDVSPDGNVVYVAGFSEDLADPDPEGAHYLLEARDARTGAEIWSSAVPTFVATQDDHGLFGLVKVRASPDGQQVFVVVSGHDGRQLSGSDIAYGVAGFDAATGAFRWRGSYRRVDAPSRPKAMAVDPHGRFLYVTGQGGERNQTSVQTVAFLIGARYGR